MVEVSGAIWVSWYLGQSQTDKNTESTATPPNTNTQCGFSCSSRQLQIFQRTNKKERPPSNSSKFKCSLLCEFIRYASNEEEDRSIAIPFVNLNEQFLCLQSQFNLHHVWRVFLSREKLNMQVITNA